MAMIEIYIIHFSICVAALALIILFGIIFKAFIAFESNTTYSNLQSNLLFGLILSTTLYSIFHTSGVTINILLIFIGILFCKFKRPKLSNKIKIHEITRGFFSQIGIVTLFCLPFFTFEFYYFVKNGEFNFIITHLDFNDYAIISNSISEFGNENRYYTLNAFYPNDYKGVTPYHYFELWFSILLSKSFFISPVKALILVSFPVLKTILFFSLFNLVKSLTSQVFFINCTISLILMFVSGFYLPIYEDYELTKYFIGYTQSSPMAWGKKYLMMYIISATSLNLIIQKKYVKGLIISLIIPILSIGSAPASFASMFLMFFINALKEKSVVNLCKFFIFILLFLVFYKIFTIKITTNNIVNFALYSQILSDPFEIKLYRHLFFSFVFPFARAIIFYFPFIFIIIYLFLTQKNIENENKFTILSLFIMAISLLVFGSLASALMNGIYDSGQLLYNILPQVNLIIGILIFLLVKNKINFVIVLSSLLIVSFLQFRHNHNVFLSWTPKEYNIHSDSFKKYCINQLELSEKSEIIAYAMRDEFYAKGPLIARYSNPCYFLQFNSKGCYLIDINIFKAFFQLNKLSSLEVYTFKELFEYMVFLKQIQKEHLGLKLQKLFIKKFKISYLYLQHGAIVSDDLESLFDKKNIGKDTISGDRFIKLKPTSH